jgi:hypothetical protein
MAKKDEIFIKEYEIMVDSTMQVTNWRQNANNFYLTVNTALLSVDAYLLSASSHIGLVVGVSGIIITILWRATILYYGDLNKVKFNIIHKMEEKLPVALFKDEWTELKKKHRRITPTRIEKWVPVIFLLAYLFVLGSYVYPILITYL